MSSRLIAPRNRLILPKGMRKPANPILDTQHPLSRGLVGCYLLGDYGGQAIDITPYGNHAAFTNGPSPTFAHHGGTSTGFGGSTYASAPDAPQINLPNTLSLSAWVYPTAGIGTYRTFVAKSNSPSATERAFELAASGPEVFFFILTQGVGNFVGVNAVSAIAYNTWTHVCGTYDGTTAAIYINGVLEATANLPGGTDTGAWNLTLGSLTTIPTENFPGNVEGVRIYNRAITGGEAKQLYSEPYAGIYDFNRNIVGVASSSITGTASWTEAQDTWAGAGAVAVSGTAAWTEAQDIWAGAGSLISSGPAAWTEAPDIWAGVGTVADGITGSASWIEAQDTWAAAGAVAISGSAAWTEIQDTWGGTGTITLPAVTGAASWIEAPDSWAGTGLNGQTGGHFLPLSKKALEKAHKEARRIEKARESQWAARAKELDDITREMSEIANPAPKPKRPILTLPAKPLKPKPIEDDEDAEIEMLLLYG